MSNCVNANFLQYTHNFSVCVKKKGWYLTAATVILLLSAASRGDTCLKFTQSILVSLLISVSPTRSEQWGKMQVQHVLWLADASAGRPRHDLREVQTIMTAARNRIAVATWFICRWGGADGVKTALFPTPQTVRFSTIRWTLRECRRLEESFFLRVTQQSYSNLQCNSIIQREQVTDRTRSSLIKLQHRAAHAQCPVFCMSCSFRNKHDHPWSLVFTCINDLQWRSFEVFLVQNDSHHRSIHCGTEATSRWAPLVIAPTTEMYFRMDEVIICAGCHPPLLKLHLRWHKPLLVGTPRPELVFM